MVFQSFRLMTERDNPNETHSLEIAVCEIYNNEVRDLLAGKNKSSRVIWQLPASYIQFVSKRDADSSFFHQLDIVTSSEGATEIPSLVTRLVSPRTFCLCRVVSLIGVLLVIWLLFSRIFGFVRFCCSYCCVYIIFSLCIWCQ